MHFRLHECDLLASTSYPMHPDRTNSGNSMHNGSNGTTLMKRSVAAIDNAGKVLWTIDLN